MKNANNHYSSRANLITTQESESCFNLSHKYYKSSKETQHSHTNKENNTRNSCNVSIEEEFKLQNSARQKPVSCFSEINSVPKSSLNLAQGNNYIIPNINKFMSDSRNVTPSKLF